MPRNKKRKPVAYPKRLRQTLERMADAREEGEEETLREEALDFVTHSFWRDFLPEKAVHFMHMSGDEVLNRLSVTYYLDPPVFVEYVRTKPPWEEAGGQ